MSTAAHPSPYLSTPRPMGLNLAETAPRVEDLVAAHRHVQASHRAALAAEAEPALVAAAQRLHALAETIRHIAGSELAVTLTREALTGTALIVALTSDDATSLEIDTVLATYQARRADVDAITRGKTDPP